MRGNGRLGPIVAAAILAGVVLGACGGGSSSGGRGAGAGQSTPAGAPPGVTPSPRQPFRPPVGAALRVRARGGATLVVRVTAVLDPLRRAGVSLLPGTRAVGVIVRIRNRGPGEYDSSSTGDVSIVPASGPAAAAFASRGRCMTQDRDFDNAIPAGETRVGCVVFSLDAGARLAAVRFSANAGGAGGAGVATWQPRAR
ncbi:MAG: hypothetical protein QOE27_34 [Solirubrobacteraceae bacterium]|nr:hypothetical protein [Solirubrobacteraceae bacterium]